MAKIIKIDSSTVLIGLDDGSITEVDASSLNFVPCLDDQVQIFQSNGTTIVSKVAQNTNNNTTINFDYTNTTHGKLVNKVAYVLLALFAGGIGIHKFYAGKTGAGIAYLLFCWTGVPSIIAVIDLIIGLTKPADSAGMISF